MNFRQKFNFPKIASMRGTNNLFACLNFTSFVKNSIFQKLPKIVEKHFFWWKGNKQFIPKNFFFTQLEIVLNFHYFCKVCACWISVKNSNFQKLPKIVEKHFFWWKEQIILPKNIFLTQFEMVLNFHYFCKVRACRISVKNSNFKKID